METRIPHRIKEQRKRWGQVRHREGGDPSVVFPHSKQHTRNQILDRANGVWFQSEKASFLFPSIHHSPSIHRHRSIHPSVQEREREEGPRRVDPFTSDRSASRVFLRHATDVPITIYHNTAYNAGQYTNTFHLGWGILHNPSTHVPIHAHVGRSFSTVYI